ncbi:MAG: lysophospholipid acyltransferase family protein [Deltaproteobacteria bacterium]|nr:lysophospholipid acyltransferase family protein [Deltaproteobacteria bacterium]
MTSLLSYGIAQAYLAVFGWKLEGEMPPLRKAIFIAAPHTSAWDAPFMLAVAWSFRMRLSFIAKHTLLEGLKGPFMRWLGAVPVDRRAPLGQVAQIVLRMNESDGMFLAIAPEGTRSLAEHWKSGFYRMAVGANVPIVCGFLDYERKVGGLGPVFVPSGDIVADMERIRAFYEPIRGCKPDQFATPRLREELESATS